MGITFIRTIVLYLIVIASVRIMGKRQIGELQPSELVIAIMISDLATIPMQETGIPLLSGIIPIVTLIVLEVLLSYFSLKSKLFRKIATGVPSVIIRDGQVIREELERLRFSSDDLLEELRLSGVDEISEIQYAILETNGELSVMLKKEFQPLTLHDAKELWKQKEGK